MGRYYLQSGTTKRSTFYLNGQSAINTYYVDVHENNTVFSTTREVATANTNDGLVVALHAVPIS